MTAAREERAVVLGRYSDNSGLSESVYGPYSRRKAEAVAKDLSDGSWHGMFWEAVPIAALPGERPSVVTR